MKCFLIVVNIHTNERNNKSDSAVKRPSESSHNRLFGDVERVPPTPKTYHKSNIPIGSVKDTTDAPKLTNGNGTMNGNGNGHAAAAATSNGNGNGEVAHENGHAKTNGTNGHVNGSRGKYSLLFYMRKRTLFCIWGWVGDALKVSGNVAFGGVLIA